MLGRNHVIVGLGLYLAVDSFWGMGGTAPGPYCLAAAALGSLTPDLDSPKSFLGRKFLPLSWTVSSLAGHRGFTHSLLACVLILLGVAVADQHCRGWPAYFAAFGIGYASHILADWLTAEGVPLLWPNRKRFRCPLRLKTGGLGELLFSLVAGPLLGIWLCRFLL